MKRYLPYIVGTFLVVGMFGVGLFINSQNQTPAQFSSTLPKAGTVEVLDRIQKAKDIFNDRTLLNSANCANKLTAMYDEVNSLKLDQFSLQDLKTNAPSLIQELFNLRVYIRENLQRSYFDTQGNPVTPDCAFAHRKLFRAIRVFEDYIGMLHENVFQAPGTTVRTDENFYRVFKGGNVNFMWNEKYKPANPLDYVPRSGDVLMSRGSASVSAAIARITDEDSNFSHAGIVYVDPVSKKIETVEAHIEFGTLLADIKDYSDMKVRSLVFRFNDPKLSPQENAKLAHEAATKVRQIVIDYKKKYKNSGYPNPCYDFSMNIDNPAVMVPSNDPTKRKCLFCSEVVSLAFSLVAQGKYKIPAFKSSINPKNRKFLEDIGVTVKETFAPADLEIDPNFDLVLEWRDYIRVHKTHVMDAILTSMYSWMDKYQYQFFVGPLSQLKTDVAYTLRRIPLLDRLTGVKEKFPLNMGTDAINTMLMLDEVSNQMANVLYDKEKLNGANLTPSEMLQTLNDWRAQDVLDYANDSANYNTGADKMKKYRVHHLLRAK